MAVEAAVLPAGAAAPRVCERILRALPDWFGLESAIRGYVREAGELPGYVALVAGQEVGYMALKPHATWSLEIQVMGVLRGCQRHGVGRALVEAARAHARAGGFAYLSVKTLAPSHPDPGYAATRAFYIAMGFSPLEELPTLWGADNPALLMLQPVAPEVSHRGRAG